MMKSQFFVYTRNFDNDYKTIIAPSEDFCEKEIRKMFLNQIRGLINVEQFDDPLTNPRWLFSKIGNRILFGLGTNNYALNNEYYKDFAGRPVRGFFGIVVDSMSDEIKLPVDTKFYSDFYSKHILPVWNQDREHFTKHVVELDCDLSNYHCIEKKDNDIQLNFDANKSLILGDVGIEDSLAKALYSSKDTSIAIGFSNKNHAFSADYSYLNSIVEGVSTREERVLKQEAIQDRCSSSGNGMNKVEESMIPKKKAISPKVILVIIAALLVCLMIFRMIQGTTTKQSPSGSDKEELKIQVISDSLSLDSTEQETLQN